MQQRKNFAEAHFLLNKATLTLSDAPGRPAGGGGGCRQTDFNKLVGWGKDQVADQTITHTVQTNSSSCVDHPRLAEPLIPPLPPRPTLHHGWPGRQSECGGLGRLTMQPVKGIPQSDDSGSVGGGREG